MCREACASAEVVSGQGEKGELGRARVGSSGRYAGHHDSVDDSTAGRQAGGAPDQGRDSQTVTKPRRGRVGLGRRGRGGWELSRGRVLPSDHDHPSPTPFHHVLPQAAFHQTDDETKASLQQQWINRMSASCSPRRPTVSSTGQVGSSLALADRPPSDAPARLALLVSYLRSHRRDHQAAES